MGVEYEFGCIEFGLRGLLGMSELLCCRLNSHTPFYSTAFGQAPSSWCATSTWSVKKHIL